MSAFWSITMPVVQPALVALATSLAVSIPAAALALLKWAWSRAVVNGEAARASALGRLGDIGARAGAQLAATIMADPKASAAIEEAKNALVATMTGNVRETLTKLGGSPGGVEQLVLGKTAEALPAQVLAAAQAAAATGSAAPDATAILAAMSRLRGTPVAG
ncbi:hypothetical protein [Roseomonas elaeocarpi]|uniref:Uncharacterized protein n=1 Tax=Roseomonas elaeocarpi TaxID=907779 RepID=A0ABV6JS47_9PROT